MGPAVGLLGRGIQPESPQQLLGDAEGTGAVAAVEQDREFVASDPGQRVGLADGAGQQESRPDEELVAGGVAERVVDELEAVEVEEEDRAGLVVAGREPDRALQLLGEASTVEQAGQGVVVGEVLELALRALAVGDVHDVGDRLGLLAVSFGEHRTADEHPDGVSVAVDQALLELDVVAVTDRQLAELDGRLDLVLGMCQGGQRGADELVEGPPEDPGEGGVDLEQTGVAAGFEREQADPDRRAVERRVEAFLGGPHGILQADAVGDVPGDRRRADYLAGGAVDQGDPQGDIDPPAVLGQADGLERLDPLAARELREDPGVLVTPVGRHEHPERAADRLGRRVAEEVLSRAVPALDLAVERFPDDRVLGRVDEGGEMSPRTGFLPVGFAGFAVGLGEHPIGFRPLAVAGGPLASLEAAGDEPAVIGRSRVRSRLAAVELELSSIGDVGLEVAAGGNVVTPLGGFVTTVGGPVAGVL